MHQVTTWNNDYSPWERRRTTATGSSSPISRIKLSPVRNHAPTARVSNETSSQYHRASKEYVLTRAWKPPGESDQIKLLQLQVNFKRQLLQDSHLREEAMLNDNLKLKDFLEGDEEKTFANVKNLLRKYERYRGGMEKINGKFCEEVQSAEEKLELTKHKVENELSRLHEDLKKVDEQLKNKQHELQSLRSFKDNDFAMKDLQIADLVRKIDFINAQQMREITELQRIVDLENEKMERNTNKVIQSVRADVASNAAEKVLPSVDEIARENKRLRREIDIVLEESARTRESIKAGKIQVEQLRADPKIDVRRTMFPELYRTPRDSDEFDIPTCDWLPI